MQHLGQALCHRVLVPGIVLRTRPGLGYSGKCAMPCRGRSVGKGECGIGR